jgi:hypothetical protein
LFPLDIIEGQPAGLGNKADVTIVGQLVLALGYGDDQAVEHGQQEKDRHNNPQTEMRRSCRNVFQRKFARHGDYFSGIKMFGLIRG